MASEVESDLTFEQVLEYFRDNGGSVRNRDVVTHFRRYLTDIATKDDARKKFKEYVNRLAVSKVVNGEKFLYLKTRYLQYQCPSSPLLTSSPKVIQLPRAPPPPLDPMNSIGIPISPHCSPSQPIKDYPPSPQRQPPPYRPPPPVSSPSPSLDTISLNSFTLSLQESGTPQPPPRRKSSEKFKLTDDEPSSPTTPKVELRRKNPLDEYVDDGSEEKEADVSLSVKERTQKFNRLASVEGEERSPRTNKTPERTIKQPGVDEDDGASVTSNLEPKKCVEWYVMASKGDCQELLKLAKDEPRLVNKKDPFTAYTVLHWGAKHGNADIIKVFAGNYKVDVNSKTNGGYTPLHIAAQFGHKNIFKLLIEVYKANSNVRDYSGRTPDYYLLAKEQTGPKNNVRKLKRGKKQSEKDLSFLRIGSLNVRVKKTTEAFSNFLGVGSGSVNPTDEAVGKIHKGWGSADNVNNQGNMPAPKGYIGRKKSKYSSGNISNSTPTTPKQSRGMHVRLGSQDSDSDTAAGFDSQWKK